LFVVLLLVLAIDCPISTK